MHTGSTFLPHNKLFPQNKRRAVYLWRRQERGGGGGEGMFSFGQLLHFWGASAAVDQWGDGPGFSKCGTPKLQDSGLWQRLTASSVAEESKRAAFVDFVSTR